MKFISFILCCLILSSCSFKQTYHGVTQSAPKITNGQHRNEITKLLGQESLMSNLENCIFYIGYNAKHPYFLRPATLTYKIDKICFENDRVISVEHSTYLSKFDKKFFKKLKSQDKITTEDFFREVIGTSKFQAK